MNKRNFISTTLAYALGISVSLPLFAFAEKTKLTGVTYQTPSYTDIIYGQQGFVNYLTKNHADVVDIDFYDSGRLLTADKQLPALRSGNIDFMFHTSSYITRSLPILGIIGLPRVAGALYKHPERLAIGSPLFQLIQSELEKKGLKVLSLGGGVMEPEYIWSTDKAPIKTLGDIDGKRIRVVSFEANAVIASFGGAPVRIPSSELYLALQRGTVDAAVANISTISGRKIQEIIPYVYRLPLTAFSIGVFISTNRWDTLNQPTKNALLDAAKWYDANSAKTANLTFAKKQYWPAFKKLGLNVVDPDSASLEKMNAASQIAEQKWISDVGETVGRKAIAYALGKESQ
ncbi:MAG: TRAP transporter substrate-binding protein [Ostreibacterium sp.]